MRLIVIFLTLLLLSVQPVLAGQANADRHITVQINGLVCDFCAQSLEKLFTTHKEVSGITVNLDSKLVTIGLKEGMDMDDATLTKLITDAGYNIVKINR